MTAHDETIGSLKKGQESQEKRLDSIDEKVSELNNKVDSRYEESNRQYRKIVWGIAAAIITNLVGQNIIDAVMRGMGK
ncbi:hypothetical protein [Cohaesibacter gelatinilyticus]|uniref:Haemolysin XhlA n=1 Tax=Cohaesibacter gelatinilyticus TaxID=372072 RepID=A0A285PJ42_9HYPH|nr:hypothetical protein [Cohaesibacter gelatinilyticus]SNZ21742.1 hypothetical protein SAMN06265368_4867 [Cohaesibacter gelatinilyticus]